MNYVKVHYMDDVPEDEPVWLIPHAPEGLGHEWCGPITDTADGEITYFCTRCLLGLYWNGFEFEWAHNRSGWISEHRKPIISCKAALMDTALE